MKYFDSTATTKPSLELLDLYKKVNLEYFYNSSTLYKQGVRSNNLVNKAKEKITEVLKLKQHEVLFTSGATEANNTAIFGYVNRFMTNDTAPHIITTILEHASVLNPVKELEARGAKVTYLLPKEDGQIDINELVSAICKDTVLISIMWVNNIIGTILPISKIIEVKKKYPKIKLHVDAVQGIGKLPLSFDLNDIDLITISGHKIHGLKGTGALLYKNNITLKYMLGGHQQNSVRPGTVDTAGCVCLAKALDLALINQGKLLDIVNELYNHLYNSLKDLDFIIINKPVDYSPYILSITFKHIYGQTVLNYLDDCGIIVGTGSACNSKISSEETLNNIYHDSTLPLNTIRISLDENITKEDIDYLVSKIKELGTK